MHPLLLINPHRPRRKPQHSNQPHSHPRNQHTKIDSEVALSAKYDRAGALDLRPNQLLFLAPSKTTYLQNYKTEDRSRRGRSVA